MVGAAQSGAIVMVWACVAVRLGSVESTTVTVKSKVPAAVGVPVIAPVEGASVRPGGRVPAEVTRPVNGAVPPLDTQGVGRVGVAFGAVRQRRAGDLYRAHDIGDPAAEGVADQCRTGPPG